MRNGTVSDYIIIIGASDLTLPAYEVAHSLGYKTIGVDGDENAPAMALSDIKVVESTKDPKAVVSALQSITVDAKGILTCGADVEKTVSYCADRFGLRAVPHLVAERCNNKVSMHRHLEGFSFLHKPRWFTTRNGPSSVKNFTHYVVKPLAECASRGVGIVLSEEDIDPAWEEAKKYGEWVLVEEYLEGTKHTVEMIADKAGHAHLISIIDTHYLSPKIPCERLLNTTRLSQGMQDQLEWFAALVGKMMGIYWGPFKVDVNVAPDGKISLIELTCRLSGGFHCQYASPAAYGTCEIEAVIRMAVGEDLDTGLISHKYNRGAAVVSVFPPPGSVTAIYEEGARRCRGVDRIHHHLEVGQKVGPYHNSADRVCWIMVSADDTSTAVSYAEYAARWMVIETDPTCPVCSSDMKETRRSIDEPISRMCVCGVSGDYFPQEPVELYDRY